MHGTRRHGAPRHRLPSAARPLVCRDRGQRVCDHLAEGAREETRMAQAPSRPTHGRGSATPPAASGPSTLGRWSAAVPWLVVAALTLGAGAAQAGADPGSPLPGPPTQPPVARFLDPVFGSDGQAVTE